LPAERLIRHYAPLRATTLRRYHYYAILPAIFAIGAIIRLLLFRHMLATLRYAAFTFTASHAADTRRYAMPLLMLADAEIDTPRAVIIFIHVTVLRC